MHSDFLLFKLKQMSENMLFLVKVPYIEIYTAIYQLYGQQWDHPYCPLDVRRSPTRCKGAVSKLNLMCTPLFEIHKYVK